MNVIDLDALDGSDGFRIDGEAGNDSAGYSVAGLGDVNGDGFADVGVGVRNADANGRQDSGSGFIIFGQTASFTAPSVGGEAVDVRIDGAAQFDQAGLGFIGVGDLDQDGKDDIAIGSPFADPNGVNNAGELALVSGSALTGDLDLAALDATEGTRILGSEAFGAFGRDGLANSAPDPGYDIDGDGLADLGAEEFIFISTGVGSLLAGALFPGETTDNIEDAATLSSTDGAAEVGASIGVGDLNGDGREDVVTTLVEGSVAIFTQLFNGQDVVVEQDLDGADGFTITGATFQPGEGFGRAIGGLGDVNGDGFDDFGIGAPTTYDNGGAPAKTANGAIVFGGSFGQGGPVNFDFAPQAGPSGFDVNDTIRFSTAAVDDYAGSAIGGLGDVNGDGIDDFFVGAYNADPGGRNNAGSLYVVFGRAAGFSGDIDLDALDASQGFRVDGLTPGDRLGKSAAAAGDVNGDGFDDIIVGAYGGDAAAINAGEAYVIFGFDTGAVTHTGTAAGESVTGNGQANVMILGAGDDTFNAGGGNDVVRGGEGRDTGSLGAGNDRAFGGTGDDVLNGSLGDDFLYGQAGVDRLTLGGGNDYADGGSGTDLFFARADELGAGDRIFGGLGTQDTLVLLSTGVLDLTSLDAFTGIERVRVAANQQVTSVDEDINWTGRSGSETYNLGDGRDILRAGGGADVISGGGGNDTLLAQAGDDRIEGGAGTDRIVTSFGADVIVLAPGMDIDIVFDFTNGVDTFDVTAFGFTDFATDIQPRIDTVNGKAVVDLAPGDRLILNGVPEGDLDAGDFILS